MQFLADVNIAARVVSALRSFGHDVLYAAEHQAGASDPIWLAKAEAEGRLLLTADKDFGELVFRDRLNTHSVVLLRLEHLTIEQRIARLGEVLSVIEANPEGRFIVVTEGKVRVRTVIGDNPTS